MGDLHKSLSSSKLFIFSTFLYIVVGFEGSQNIVSTIHKNVRKHYTPHLVTITIHLQTFFLSNFLLTKEFIYLRFLLQVRYEIDGKVSRCIRFCLFGWGRTTGSNDEFVSMYKN